MLLRDLMTAFALMLIIEGLLPFFAQTACDEAAPQGVRRKHED